MTYLEVKARLKEAPKRWLITGVAGFIGSNLLEELLRLEQFVIGLDNFSTGKQRNIDEVLALVTDEQRKRFTFVEGDIRDLEICRKACSSVDYVLHQAALGSVPRSINDPLTTHEVNVSGTLNMLIAARDAQVKRFVYASSSSVYGDHPGLLKSEEAVGKPLSPYAATKLINEQYAGIFAETYGLDTIGLRYFNVFGPRQDPKGPYAAVIPKWVAAMIHRNSTFINGTGETSRDFCYVENVVQANILAAMTENAAALNQIFNVAMNNRTTLNELFDLIRTHLLQYCPHLEHYKPAYRNFRKGDVMHSQAEVKKARELLGYEPTHTFSDGLDEALNWYRQNLV